MVYLRSTKYIVSIGNIVMETHPSGDYTRFQLDDEMVEGWWDGVGIRRERVNRSVQWGDFAAESYKDARVTTWKGAAVAKSIYELQAMRDEFMGTLHQRDDQWMCVESSSAGKRYTKVGLDDAPRWVQLTDTTAMFQISFYSPDPRVYGEEKVSTIFVNDGFGGLTYQLTYPLDYHTTPGKITEPLYNNGNVVSYPIFDIRGDFPSGIIIRGAKDQQLVFPGTITPQSPVEIDTRTGSAIQNGIDRSALLTDRRWVTLEPLEQINPQVFPIAKASSGYCNIKYRDTYI